MLNWTSLIGHSQVYSPFGVGFSKEFIFSKNGGPVFYVRADIFGSQHWEDELMPFFTPFWPKYAPKGTCPLPKLTHLDYSHEREWRVAGNLKFEYSDIAFVILQDYKAMARFPQNLKDAIGREKFLLLDNYKKIEALWPVHKL